MKKDLSLVKENNVETVVSVVLNTLFDYSEGFLINFEKREIYKIYTNLEVELFKYSKLIESDKEENINVLFDFLVKELSNYFTEKDSYLEFEGETVNLILNKRLLLEFQILILDEKCILSDLNGDIKISLNKTEENLFKRLNDIKQKEITDYNFKEKDFLRENLKQLERENNFIKKENLSDTTILNKRIEELKTKENDFINRLKTLNQEIGQKTTLIFELEENLKDKKSKLENQKEKNEKLEKSLKEVQKNEKDLTNKIKELNKDIFELRDTASKTVKKKAEKEKGGNKKLFISLMLSIAIFTVVILDVVSFDSKIHSGIVKILKEDKKQHSNIEKYRDVGSVTKYSSENIMKKSDNIAKELGELEVVKIKANKIGEELGTLTEGKFSSSNLEKKSNEVATKIGENQSNKK